MYSDENRTEVIGVFRHLGFKVYNGGLMLELAVELYKPQPNCDFETLTIHTVIPGDTLLSIAMEYGVTIEALLMANNLEMINELYGVVMELVIPD